MIFLNFSGKVISMLFIEKFKGLIMLNSIILGLKRILNKGQKRTVKAKKNISLMLFARGINILISLLYVPLLINTLDKNNYGIWLTLTSLIAWLNLFDIGLGNGLRNRLASSLAVNDIERSRNYISTAYFAIGCFCLLLILIFLCVNPFLTWIEILNAPVTIESDLSKLPLIVIMFFLIQFFFQIINSILLAFQMPSYSSLILTSGQLLSYILVALSVYVFKITGILNLGTIISVSPVVVVIVFTLILFKTKFKQYKPSIKYIKFEYLNDILGLGLKFFLLQIITIVLFQSSNIIIAQNIGPESVTEYNIAYKYMGIISMVFTIIVTPFWSATTDAYHKGDLNWIKKVIKNLNLIWIAFTLSGSLLILISGPLYKIWLGNSLRPNKTILFLSLIYFSLNMYYSIYGYVLNGIEKIKLQMVVTSIMAIIFIPAAIYCTKVYRLYGIFSCLIAVAFMNTLWSKIQFEKIINGKATGIWCK